MALAGKAPTEAKQWLQQADNVSTGAVENVHIGPLQALKFTAKRKGGAELRFQDSGYRSELEGEPIEIFAVVGTTS